jgi:two-component system response regulator EvgA
VTPVRVLLVDDQALFREALATLLAVRDEVEVVGEAADGAEALRAVEELHPDVVLLDVQLPDTDGFDVAARLTRMNARAPAVVLTSSRDSSDYRPLIERSGARGFIPKAELCGDAIAALT